MKRVTLQIETSEKEHILDVTSKVQEVISAEFGEKSGFAFLFCPHTTAAVSVNESDDPDVKRDFLLALNEVLHFEDKFRHAEGNSKAHVSSLVTGCSAWVAVEKGKLVLGHWQSVWFCEFDGPRKRSLWVQNLVV